MTPASRAEQVVDDGAKAGANHHCQRRRRSTAERGVDEALRFRGWLAPAVRGDERAACRLQLKGRTVGGGSEVPATCSADVDGRPDSRQGVEIRGEPGRGGRSVIAARRSAHGRAGPERREARLGVQVGARRRSAAEQVISRRGVRRNAIAQEPPGVDDRQGGAACEEAGPIEGQERRIRCRDYHDVRDFGDLADVAAIWTPSRPGSVVDQGSNATTRSPRERQASASAAPCAASMTCEAGL